MTNGLKKMASKNYNHEVDSVAYFISETFRCYREHDLFEAGIAFANARTNALLITDEYVLARAIQLLHSVNKIIKND